MFKRSNRFYPFRGGGQYLTAGSKKRNLTPLPAIEACQPNSFGLAPHLYFVLFKFNKGGKRICD